MAAKGTQLALDLRHRVAMGREDFLVSPSNADAVAWIDRWPDWPGPALVIVGPPADPAKVSGRNDAAGSLKMIADANAVFASRGDDSGTHKKELRLWKAAGVDVKAASGGWYRETGSGMGATLNASVGMGAYAMTDRATWIAFKNKGDFKIAVEGDEAMFNQYGIMQVNPARCPNVKASEAKALVDWIITRDGQSAIASYKLDGQQLFFANAAKEGAS